ncbi:MAG: RsbRD N-terminal domain-containing protein [Nitrospirota bacterium]
MSRYCKGDMELKNLLSEKRDVILERWFDLILKSYPADTSSFLRNQKNQSTNPVGHTILKSIEGLFDKLIEGLDHTSGDSWSSFLDNIIRIKAVQDFTPSHALSFIFDLKKIIREELKNDPVLNSIQDNSGSGNGITVELSKLDSRIDALALDSFDIYMKCREKIYDLKAKEFENKTFRLLQMANLIYDKEEEQRLDKDHGNLKKAL